MNRREALRLLPLAGLAIWSGWQPGRPLPAMACYMVSNAPQADIDMLMRLPGFAGVRGLEITTRSMAPAAQDLTLIRGGEAVDPVQDPAVPPALAAFARSVRERPGHGHRLIAIEQGRRAPGDLVRFEVNGVVQDQVALDRNYARIAIAGAAGRTVFRLENRELTVIEASCRHELCRKVRAQGTGRIICAPNRLVATLPPGAGGVDAITG
jgi:hypothetical protein